MKIDISSWDKFEYEKIFQIKKGFYNKKPDESGKGKIRFLGAYGKNNGVTSEYTLDEINAASKTGKSPNQPINKKIFPPHAVCVTNNGASVGYAYYQNKSFTCSHDVNPLYLKNSEFNQYTGLFVATMIMYDRYRWGYGRKWRPTRMKRSSLLLPIKHDKNNNPIVDNTLNYNDAGHIPDWDYMERYIKSLKWDIVQTANILKNVPDLNTKNWQNFKLHKIVKTEMGNGIDANKTSSDNPTINYVSRNSNNNGVVNVIDKIDGEKLFPADTMTLALGGSYLGACFVQPKPFYTAQNVGILTAPKEASIKAKLFLATIIRKECRLKYHAFGRELNSHFRKDLSIKLPVKRDLNGQPIIDTHKEFNSKGYIPDWQAMSNYIDKLPYGDKLDI